MYEHSGYKIARKQPLSNNMSFSINFVIVAYLSVNKLGDDHLYFITINELHYKANEDIHINEANKFIVKLICNRLLYAYLLATLLYVDVKQEM